MKQLGLLIVGAFLFVACDATPGGNKGVLPIVHDGHKEEIVDETQVETAENNLEEAVEETTENVEEVIEETTEETTSEEVNTEEVEATEE